ncbi:MAG: murein hydrolase activator EnvC family protein [Actinomycetota bacterium]
MPTLRPSLRALAVLVALTLAVASAIVVRPTVASADTQSEFAAARAQLGGLQDALRKATEEWNRAEAALEETIWTIANAEAEIARLEREAEEALVTLQDRAVLAFQVGRTSSLESLLSSGSLTEFTDRVEFLSQIAQGDADLAILAATAAERIRQRQDELRELRAQQAEEARDLDRRRRDLDARLDALQARVNELSRRLREEQVLLGVLGQSLRPGAPISRCPIAGVNSFVDSFGWPRPGDRTHQGIDLIASYGTPIVAVADGWAVSSSSTLGGNSVWVESGGGATYYAHLSRYGTLGRVSAGTVIGYVGATGFASGPHLHFEYHPSGRGGSAINPYAALNVVC